MPCHYNLWKYRFEQSCSDSKGMTSESESINDLAEAISNDQIKTLVISAESDLSIVLQLI